MERIIRSNIYSIPFFNHYRRVAGWLIALVLIWAQPLHGEIVGDIELLKLVADGYEVSTDRFRTLKGQANVSCFVNGHLKKKIRRDYTWQEKSEFLIDRGTESGRWKWEKVNQKDVRDGKAVTLMPSLGTGMVKGSYAYDLTFPDKPDHKRSLAVIQDKDFPRHFQSPVMDPVYILTEEVNHDGIVDSLRFFYDHAANFAHNNKHKLTISNDNNIVHVVYERNDVDEGKHSIKRFAFDLSKNCHLIEKYESFDEIECHYKFSYKMVDDVYVLKTASKEYHGKYRDFPYISKRNIVVETEMVNEPIDPEEFTLEKIGMRPGDMVFDRIAGGISYIWKPLPSMPLSSIVQLSEEASDSLNVIGATNSPDNAPERQETSALEGQEYQDTSSQEDGEIFTPLAVEDLSSDRSPAHIVILIGILLGVLMVMSWFVHKRLQNKHES